MSDIHAVPAAWYADPAGSGRERYWNGSAWTEQLRDSPAFAAASSVAGAPSDSPGLGHIAEQVAYVPFTRADVHALQDGASASTTGGTSTIAIYLYALTPALLLLNLLFSWSFAPADFADLLIHGGIALATAAIALVLASIDRSQLRSRGYLGAPPPVLGLLPPVYVIARSSAVGPGALPATLSALVVQAAVVVLLVVPSMTSVDPAVSSTESPVDSIGMTAPFSDAQLAHLLTPEGMADKIRFDAAASSLRYDTVECEPLSSTALGAQTTCHATGHLASYDLVVQVLPDGTDTPFAVISVTPILQ
jgi:hypothetical protein